MQSWLFDINERIKALEAVLEEQSDESVAADVKTALAGIYESDVPQAVEDGIEYIKRQESMIAQADARIKEYQSWKKLMENRLKRVKAGYTDFLISAGMKKVETPSGRMTVAAPTARTIVDDINQLPDAYKRTTVKIDADLTAIKQAIQCGHMIKGAHLEEHQSIRIK